MQTLTSILTEQTQDLKKEYLAQTAIWAVSRFEAILKMKELAKRCAEFKQMTSDVKEEYYAAMKFLYKQGGFTIIDGGLERFQEGEVKKAEVHYADSIAKLAGRLEAKGIAVEDIQEIVSGRPSSGNFETTIRTSKGTVRAWTIIASGPIQRPHYRYLVK